MYVFAFQSESAIVKERELSLELARIRDEVGKWDSVWQIWHHLDLTPDHHSPDTAKMLPC